MRPLSGWDALAIIGALLAIIFGGWLIITAAIYVLTGTYPVEVGPRTAVAVMALGPAAFAIGFGLDHRRGR